MTEDARAAALDEAQALGQEFDGLPHTDAHELGAVDGPGHRTSDAQRIGVGTEKHEIAGQAATGAHVQRAGNGAVGGHQIVDAHKSYASDRTAIIAQIIEISRQNAFAIRQRMRLNQATLSYIARQYFGYHTGLTEAERAKAMDGAGKLARGIEKDLLAAEKSELLSIAQRLGIAVKKFGASERNAAKDIAGAKVVGTHDAADIVIATRRSVEQWLHIEEATEKDLVKLAKQLPAYAWVKHPDQHGFGEVSFARIIGEAGDLSNYANPGKVWKRLGLAVHDGHAQRKSRNKDEAEEQGYSPRRRSVVWQAFDPVIRLQKNSGGQVHDDDHQGDAAGDDSDHDRLDAHDGYVDVDGNGAGHRGIDAHWDRAGPYYRIYAAKKAEYLARGEAGEKEWTKLHSDRAAKRYASKRLMRDLWRAWRDEVTE